MKYNVLTESLPVLEEWRKTREKNLEALQNKESYCVRLVTRSKLRGRPGIQGLADLVPHPNLLQMTSSWGRRENNC